MKNSSVSEKAKTKSVTLIDMKLAKWIKIIELFIEQASSLSCNYYYHFIDIYELEIVKIVKIIESNWDQNFEKQMKNEVIFLERKKIPFIFNEIRDERQYLIHITAILILKSFLNLQKKFKEDDPTEKEKRISYAGILESDEITNDIVGGLKSFFIWFERCLNKNTISKILLEINEKKFRKYIYSILILLTQEKIIEKETIFIGKKSKIFFSINYPLKNLFFLAFYQSEFEMYERNSEDVYICSDHYTNLFELLIPNISTGKRIKIDLKSNYIKNALQIRAKIDYELLESFFQRRLERKNYKREDLFSRYQLLLEEIKHAIRGKNDSLRKKFTIELSEIIDLLRIYQILNNKSEDFFYFPFLICFRGRTYFSSILSFGLYKEFRYCLYEGEYDKNFIQPSHPLNSKIEKIWSPQLKKLKNIKKFRFEEKPYDIQISVIWILVSITEIFKSKIGKIITNDQWIDYAIEFINQDKIFINDDYDNLKFESLLKILSEMEKDIYIKRLVCKDATASCFQHLIKILGDNSPDALKWCNLDSEDAWYDPYSKILENWKMEMSNSSDKKLALIDTFFFRKSIKRTIMTAQYGAMEKRCWSNFILECGNIPSEDWEELKKLFSIFYKYINSNVGILKTDSKEIKNQLMKNSYKAVLNDGVEVDYKYAHYDEFQVRITVNHERHVKKERRYNSSPNKRKMNSSARANYVHTHDGAVVRYVISIKPMGTVHDCFLIDYRSITFLIALINDAMGKVFHDMGLNPKFEEKIIFSIHIVV